MGPWVLAGILISLSDICYSFKMISVDVPKNTVTNSQVSLTCNFDLGKEKLYSVKWYKEGSGEFYRFVPGDNPPSQVFNVPWITVDQSKSNERVVVLRDLHLKASGKYYCEASSEAPRFKTLTGSGDMKVVDLPDSRPIIEGANPSGYRVGDWLEVNCTSPNSYPPANLKWYINNEVVDPLYTVDLPPIKETRDLYTAKKQLRFQLRRQHFVQEHVKVKCASTIDKQYFQTSQVQLQGINLGEKALESRTNDGLRGSMAGLQMLLVSSGLLIIMSTWP